ncbi:flagellar hook-basal body complex protein FliE [Azospirillum sp.]|uniref:flagellar hook-basal body complex protein FliE n=1 Tax=Azospirillum sp. TaxID=34012 RepID=UPI002D4BD919|nr:flagellar hook-basal body complex protein FliE [Azospirillum sp.]HYD66612.1 flagellar hook-basal body complex protein FliE [Azospirillum sp.]
MIEMPIGRVAAAYAAHKTAAPVPAAPVKATGTEAAEAAAPESSFGAFLDRQVTQAVDTLKESERVSLAAVAGKASAQDVVRSVMAAEMTVQTVVAIRDRMVQAYQDIMRMAV